MNCPQCDSLMYQSSCGCGFKITPVSTIQIKRMGAEVSSDPIPQNEIFQNTKLTGKEHAAFCMDYIKKILGERRYAYKS